MGNDSEEIKMQRAMCENGHYYDSDKYSKCPHCEAGLAPASKGQFSVSGIELIPNEKTSEKKGLFKNWGKGKRDITDDIDDKTVVEKTYTNYGISNMSSDILDDVTLAEKSVIQESEKQETSLQQEIMQAKEPRQNLDDQKTVGYFSGSQSTEPPVGYLICIAGDDFGKGFSLKSGSNAIGRSQSMDVVISDVKVSREKQAFVIYEPHKRVFYLKPGDSSGLCYYNGDVVFETVKLQAYDKLEIGNTKLMLIPVCSQEFSWDEFEE